MKKLLIGFMLAIALTITASATAEISPKLGPAVALREDGAIVTVNENGESIIGYHIDGIDYSLKEYEKLLAAIARQVELSIEFRTDGTVVSDIGGHVIELGRLDPATGRLAR